ncbi:MAG: YjiH family protein, partial [Egibacteraceae bacterium]
MSEGTAGRPTTSQASERPRGVMVKFVLTTLVGAVFFLLPVPVGGQLTIPFDVVVSTINDGAPQAVAVYCLVAILASAVLSLVAAVQARGLVSSGRVDLSAFRSDPTFLVLRLLGAVFAVMIFFGVGPQAILDENAGGLMFNTLVASVAVIVPIGAVFVTLFVAFGGLEFVGTLARPVMRPLFRVPGRAALDGIASYVGSYSIGLYVTNRMYNESRYSAREAAIIATCFSTVSMGFFAVVASTLDLLPYFPLVFGACTLVMIVLGVILCRIPPLSTKPDDYVGEPVGEREFHGNLWRH